MGPHPSVAAVRRAVRVALAADRDDAPPPERAGHDAARSARARDDAPPPAPRDRPLLVALSGGPDSTALAAATAFVAMRTGRAAGAVTVDHALQPDSARQAARAADLAYELGLDPVHIVRVEVGTAGGPEAAARTARYAALDALASDIDALVLLGHTRDDQAETVLLGLGRGSGPRSIAGMRPRDGRYLRPLLDLPRATTVQACAVLGLHVWDDPHNRDDRFTRVRLRREVLPLLEDVLGGGAAGALARTAGLLRDDLDALDALAGELVDRLGPGPLPVAELAGQPRALRTRVLRAWAHAGGTAPLTAVHVAALDTLVTAWRGQGPADLPGGYTVSRRSGRLELGSPPAVAGRSPPE